MKPPKCASIEILSKSVLFLSAWGEMLQMWICNVIKKNETCVEAHLDIFRRELNVPSPKRILETEMFCSDETVSFSFSFFLSPPCRKENGCGRKYRLVGW